MRHPHAGGKPDDGQGVAGVGGAPKSPPSGIHRNDGVRFLHRAGSIIVSCELFSSVINLSYNNADKDGTAEIPSSRQPRLSANARKTGKETKMPPYTRPVAATQQTSLATMASRTSPANFAAVRPIPAIAPRRMTDWKSCDACRTIRIGWAAVPSPHLDERSRRGAPTPSPSRSFAPSSRSRSSSPWRCSFCDNPSNMRMAGSHSRPSSCSDSLDPGEPVSSPPPRSPPR